MLYLTSQIVVAGHISQGIKILFVTAIPVTTFATFGITVVVLIASIDTWHTNSVSYFSSFVMSKTLCWSSQHYWTVYIFSTQFQRLWVWCLENKKRLWESQKSKTTKIEVTNNVIFTLFTCVPVSTVIPLYCLQLITAQSKVKNEKHCTMRNNLPKTLDQLIFCKYTLVFSKCSQIY